jgi:hypothetical protein
MCVSFSVGGVVDAETMRVPQLANYYLGELKQDKEFIATLARYDLLILSSSQIVAHAGVLREVHILNPDVLIFAYVPTQSYNTRYWPNDILLRGLQVQSSWWLTDPAGNTLEPWQNLRQIDMQESWSRYLIDFVSSRIASIPDVDGIFFDMISENISWLNNGYIDVNDDGLVDSPAFADKVWKERTTYFLSYAQEKLGSKYMIINGSSNTEYRPYVHGRMFETFPTPWEGNGSWATNMNNAKTMAINTRKPSITVFNANTNNTGNATDYRTMRFGLTSALLENAYFSFDHGDEDHAQMWWYDEYEVSLGNPLGRATSLRGNTNYIEDVWSRSFENGVSVVNSTYEAKTVSLGGEYEKIRGVQDPGVNDGSIVSEVTLAPRDGMILLKTFETLKEVVFTNGFFARFFKPTGERARNGFFVFEEGQRGGAQIAHIDLDFNKKPELIVVSGNRVQVWRDDGQILFRLYPYTANYEGELRVAVGDLNNDGFYEIYTAPTVGFSHPIRAYNRHGNQVVADFFPFGEKYSGGYQVALTKPVEGVPARLIIGSGSGVAPSVSVFSYEFKKLVSFAAFESGFRGGVNVGAGDIDGDGVQEIIVGKGEGGTPTVRIFSLEGKEKYTPFNAYTTLFKPGVDVRALDIDFDGVDEIVTLSEGAL